MMLVSGSYGSIIHAARIFMFFSLILSRPPALAACLHFTIFSEKKFTFHTSAYATHYSLVFICGVSCVLLGNVILFSFSIYMLNLAASPPSEERKTLDDWNQSYSQSVFHGAF